MSLQERNEFVDVHDARGYIGLELGASAAHHNGLDGVARNALKQVW
ncbi:hypothetical protein [Gemmatimonas aurantiaca]